MMYSCLDPKVQFYDFVKCNQLGTVAVDAGYCYYDGYTQFFPCFPECHGKTVGSIDDDDCHSKCSGMRASNY